MEQSTEIVRLENERKELIARVEAIDATLALLRGGSVDGMVDALVAAMRNGSHTPSSRSAGVGDDKLNAVRAFVRSAKRVRQADIQHKLDLNSGTVSMALRELQAEGEVVPRGKENRSRVWEIVKK